MSMAVRVSVALFLISTAVHAETQLVWSPTGTNRDVGSWQCATDGTRVLTGAAYLSSTIVTFGSLAATANVYQCSVDRPLGAGVGCDGPGAGIYDAESMQPKSAARLCVVVPPPPPPPPPPPTVPAPVITFSVLPVRINAGEPVNVDWTAQNTNSCRIGGGGPGAVIGEVPSTGIRTVVPEFGTDTGVTFLIGCDSLPGAPSGTIAVQAVTLIPPWEKPTPPGCYPVIDPAAKLYEARAIDGQDVGAWGCDNPDGFRWRTQSGEKAKLMTELVACVPEGVIGAFNGEAYAAAYSACVNRPHTVAAAVVATELTRRWHPHFEVQRGTAAAPVASRAVYTRLADGTRGSQLRIDATGQIVTTGGVLQTIATGKPCNPFRRLTGTTTRYHLVTGETSVQGRVMPDDVYSQCAKLDPPTEGWP